MRVGRLCAKLPFLPLRELGGRYSSASIVSSSFTVASSCTLGLPSTPTRSLAFLSSVSQIDTEARYRLPAEMILLTVAPLGWIRAAAVLAQARRRTAPAGTPGVPTTG